MTPIMQRIVNALTVSESSLSKTKLANILNIKGVEPRREFKNALKECESSGLIKIEGKKTISLSQSNNSKKDMEFNVPEKPSKKSKSIGIYKKNENLVYSANRKSSFSPVKIENNDLKIKDGSIVLFEKNNINESIEIIGNIENPKDFNKLSCAIFSIPNEPHKTLKISKEIEKTSFHKDLTELPFVTIDGENARDFDDAVYVETLKKGVKYRVHVAIADVANYIKPNDTNDKEALKRGNSVYFANEMIPMLPEELACGLCSLNPGVERLVLVFSADISSDGNVNNYQIKRGVIKSKKRFTYDDVQKIINKINKNIDPENNEEKLVKDLYSAHKILVDIRNKRGTLEIDTPEYILDLNNHGLVDGVAIRDRNESHELIENMMILANEGVAKMLSKKGVDPIYRVHDKPNASKLLPLNPILKKFGLKLKKNPSQHSFNQILSKSKKTPQNFLINELILRSQSQAKYTPQQRGHFGLGLSHYAHFTSPIRRYADLIVHRSLIASFNLGNGGFLYDIETLNEIGDHISNTERLADQAERNTMERLLSNYANNKIGEIFEVTISGINNRGIFLRIDSIGLEGFLPVQELPGGYYIFDQSKLMFHLRNNKITFQLGDQLKAKLISVDIYNCNVRLEPLINSIDKITINPSRKSHKNKYNKKRR